MYLAYSALHALSANQHPSVNRQQEEPLSEIALRFRAYQTACDKYSHEIAAIQQYMPGWMPEFR